MGINLTLERLLLPYYKTKNKCRERIILMRHNGAMFAFGNDADTLSGILHLPVRTEQGANVQFRSVGFAKSKVAEYIPNIINNGYKVAFTDII